MRRPCAGGSLKADVRRSDGEAAGSRSCDCWRPRASSPTVQAPARLSRRPGPCVGAHRAARGAGAGPAAVVAGGRHVHGGLQPGEPAGRGGGPAVLLQRHPGHRRAAAAASRPEQPQRHPGRRRAAAAAPCCFEQLRRLVGVRRAKRARCRARRRRGRRARPARCGSGGSLPAPAPRRPPLRALLCPAGPAKPRSGAAGAAPQASRAWRSCCCSGCWTRSRGPCCSGRWWRRGPPRPWAPRRACPQTRRPRGCPAPARPRRAPSVADAL